MRAIITMQMTMNTPMSMITGHQPYPQEPLPHHMTT